MVYFVRNSYSQTSPKKQSLEQAKVLLKAAWAKEDDSEVKAEIERRLKLLEPKEVTR